MRLEPKVREANRRAVNWLLNRLDRGGFRYGDLTLQIREGRICTIRDGGIYRIDEKGDVDWDPADLAPE